MASGYRIDPRTGKVRSRRQSKRVRDGQCGCLVGLLFIYGIMALTFDCFAHPRGSFNHRDSGRTWRLCPVFAMYETMVLIVRAITK